MKILSYIAIILFLSCNQSKSTSKNISVHINDDGIYLVEDTIKEKNEKVYDSIIVEEQVTVVEAEDCFFDQATQTDEFLKGIKELEGYVWNQETKTATIKLSENETLEIYRGGCDEFELIAKFIYSNKEFDIDNNKEFIFGRILWISKLLDEFDYKNIKKVKEDNQISLTKVNETLYYLNFMSMELYELYFSNIGMNNNNLEFSFGFYY